MNSAIRLVIKVAAATLVSGLGYKLWGVVESEAVALAIHPVAGAIAGASLGSIAFLGGPLAYVGFWNLVPHTGGDGDMGFVVAFFSAAAFSGMALIGGALRWAFLHRSDGEQKTEQR